MQLENRDVRYMIRMKPSEKQYLEREADERGQRLSEYIRAVLFANAILTPTDGRK